MEFETKENCTYWKSPDYSGHIMCGAVWIDQLNDWHEDGPIYWSVIKAYNEFILERGKSAR